MRKNFGAKPWTYPQPVFIVATYNEDGTVNMEASRRVEFKFRLKDAEMIEEMSSILEQND